MVTAENKYKKLKNGTIEHYILYHCTGRKDPNCSQRSIEEDELEKQIAKELNKLEIKDDFKNWALTRLKEMNQQEDVDRENVYGNQRREYEACVKKISNLIDMRANEEIDEEELKSRKTPLLAEKTRLQDLLKDTDKRVENWLEIAERGFNFAEKAQLAFKQGDLAIKKEIFTALGSNFILKDKILTVSLDNLLVAIDKLEKEVQATSAMFEPKESVAIRTQSAPSEDGLCARLGGWGSNPRPIGYIYPTVANRDGLSHHLL